MQGAIIHNINPLHVIESNLISANKFYSKYLAYLGISIFFLSGSIYYNQILLALGCFCSISSFILSSKRGFQILDIIFLWILVGGFLMQIGRGWGLSFAPLLLLSSWCLARFIVEDRPLKLVYFLYFLYSTYFYFSVIFLSLSPADIVIGSHNRISTLVLSFGVLIYFLDPKIKTFHALNIFLICILAQGSIGIISSFLLVIIVFMKRFKLNIFFWTFFILIFTIIFGYVINNVSQESLLFETLLKLDFARLTGEDVRFLIINDYLLSAKDNFINLYSGVRSWSFTGLSSYNNEVSTIINLHNSYLDAHLTYGIYGIFMILLIFFILIKTAMSSFFYAGLLFVILLRAFADTNFIISGYFNFVILMFLVSIYRNYFNLHSIQS